MSSEVVYFRGHDGANQALAVLEHLHPKTLARSLAFIDLLEESELPLDLDRPLAMKAAHAQNDLRTLRAYSGGTKLKFAYTRLDGKAVILGAGPFAKKSEAAKLAQDCERTIAHKSKPKLSKTKYESGLKSHREFVAELTLSDPVLAAHYTRARERTRFALSLIRLRDKAEFTSETLAERTGLSVSKIKKLSHGQLPKLETMRRLADALQAHIVIAPGGGIILEACEPIESTPRHVSVPIHTPTSSHLIVHGIQGLVISE